MSHQADALPGIETAPPREVFRLNPEEAALIRRMRGNKAVLAMIEAARDNRVLAACRYPVSITRLQQQLDGPVCRFPIDEVRERVARLKRLGKLKELTGGRYPRFKRA